VLANATLITPVPVTNLDRARAFYSDILGLPILFEDSAQRIIIVGVDGAMLELGEHEAPSAGHHSCAVFQVADPQAMDTVVEALQAGGVACERQDAHVPLGWDERDVATFDGRITAWFRDPDGNLLQLYARDVAA
jgi:catechol 2,3-dioxygenase-like lactoylglutathione lyase family enzyme